MLAPEIRQKPIREGLRELGYVEGQNLLIEWRYDDRVDRLAAFATELIGRYSTCRTQPLNKVPSSGFGVPFTGRKAGSRGNGFGDFAPAELCHHRQRSKAAHGHRSGNRR
jgi:hypothetical protein